jgi:membrane-bound inhibitor of C-type lysozyme
MKIEWNKVTSLSQIVAIVLFLAVFGAGFLIGRKYENKAVLGAPIAKAKFICEGDKAITAAFYDREVYIELPYRQNLYLPQTISGSGARYADKGETIVFWNKGNTAFIEQNGTTTFSGCVTE